MLATTNWRYLYRAQTCYNGFSLSTACLLTAEIMEKLEKTAPKKDEPVAVPNHTEKIKSQVLAKIGRPPRLDRVEVSRHHGGNYRVNIWAHPEPNKNIDITLDARIVSSYYLKVSDTGEIIRSDPPLDKLFSAA
jgi:hypothetical protein